MLKPVFDIASHDIASDQWMHCRLILALNDSFLQYAVLYETTVLIWKHYQYQSAGVAETVQHLTEIFQADDTFHHAMKTRTVVYSYPESCLIPDYFFDIGLNRNYLDLTHGNLHKGLVITEKVPGWGAYNIFRLPYELDDICTKTFVNASFRHYTSLWLEAIKKHLQANEQVNILFSEKDASVNVITNGKLQLVQCFAYQHADDVIYHLLNVFKQLRLHPEEIPVYIGGMIRADTAVYQYLARHFSLLQTDKLSEKFLLSENFRSVPEHFFSPLLKMSRCV